MAFMGRSLRRGASPNEVGKRAGDTLLRCDEFKLNQKLRVKQLRNYEEHGSRTKLAEESRSDLSIGRDVFRTRQILGHCDDVGQTHVSLFQLVDHMFPRNLRLACDVGRKIAVDCEPGSTR